MLQRSVWATALVFIFLALPALAQKKTEKKGTSKVDQPVLITMKTSISETPIEIQLDPAKAPETVANFLKYAEEGFYDGTIFHRVISDFMIQGGGFTKDMKQKSTRAPIKNEAKNGLKNERGTIAMARTSVVDSATAQFFINTKDNSALNHRSDRDYGYAVFGKVTKGLDVVDQIEAAPTHTLRTDMGPMGDVPVTAIVIESVKVSK